MKAKKPVVQRPWEQEWSTSGPETALFIALVILSAAGLASRIWLLATLGIGISVFWPKAPKAFVALICVGFGSAGLLKWREVSRVPSLPSLLGRPTLTPLFFPPRLKV